MKIIAQFEFKGCKTSQKSWALQEIGRTTMKKQLWGQFTNDYIYW